MFAHALVDHLLVRRARERRGGELGVGVAGRGPHRERLDPLRFVGVEEEVVWHDRSHADECRGEIDGARADPNAREQRYALCLADGSVVRRRRRRDHVDRRRVLPRRGSLPRLAAGRAPGRVRVRAEARRRAAVRAHAARVSHRQSAIAKPSYFLRPTVCSTVIDTRGSRAASSRNRRIARTATSLLAASASAPSRTTLSTTITLPGRESFTAQPKYSGALTLSASMNVKSNGPSSRGSVSSAAPTRTSTTSATPARARFARATSACLGSTSSVVSRPPGASARASQIVL